MQITDIILEPLVTEKTHLLKTEAKPKLSFIVHRKANKLEIKEAFKAIFGLTPLAVNTLIRKPQPTRAIAKSKKNYSKLFKIAHVTVTKADFDSLQNALNSQQ